MSSYDELAEKISKLTGTAFRPATHDDLSKLIELHLPQPIIDFYASYAPIRCAEGQVRLWPIADLLVENSSAVPGAFLAPHGYIVFASTYCGDAYCFDINASDEPCIVLISHEVVSEEISAEEARRLAKPIARNLREFLDKFVHREIEEECIY
jgi:hypothetical protein